MFHNFPVIRSFVNGGAVLLHSGKWPFVVARMFLVSAVPIFLFFYHDPNRHFLWTPDADFRFVYEALRLNSGLPHFMAALAGYGTSFVLAQWYQLLHLFGALDVMTIGAMPLAPESDAVFQELTYWARVLSVILTSTLCISLMFTAQTITGSRFYGFLAALAYSGTQSVNNHVVNIRPELNSAVFSFLAVLFVLLAVKRQRDRAISVSLIALSAFCALFSLYSKTSSLPIVLLLPLFPLFFSAALPSSDKSASTPLEGGSALALIGLFTGAGFFILFPFVKTMAAIAYFYNGAIVIYTGICIVIFGRMRNLSKMDMAAAGAAIVTGLAIAQYVLVGVDPYSQSETISNHVSYLAGIAIGTKSTTQQISNLAEEIGAISMISGIMGKMVSNVGHVFTDSFFNFCWVCRRPSIIYLLSLITLAAVLRKHNNTVRATAVFLILSVVFIETILRFHAFSNHYRMYVEGLLMATMVYYLSRISLKLSLNARKALTGFSLVFVVWFWVDDVNRKMLWPSFATHSGAKCVNSEDYPLIFDRVEGYCQRAKELDRAIEAGTVPSGTLPPWWVDNRTFIWTKEPWRRWDDK